MEGVGQVFISYPRAHSAFASSLHAHLTNKGFRVWFDTKDIPVGSFFPEEIQRGIEQSVALIAIISPLYIQRPYCLDEMHHARRLGRHILPLVLHTLKDADWPLDIERSHTLDFRSWQDPAEFNQNFATLATRLEALQGIAIDEIPDIEVRYLNRLISSLEGDRSTLPTAEGGRRIVTERFLEVGERHRTVDDIWADHPRFILLGEPGAGKTTSMRELALHAAHQRRKSPNHAPLPVYLRLASWVGEAGTYSAYSTEKRANVSRPVEIAQLIRQCDESFPFADLADDHVSELLDRGEIALFLDGLNEMGQGTSSEERIELLRRFLFPDRKAQPRFVVFSCRARDYNEELDLALDCRATLRPLGHEEIGQIVRMRLDSEINAARFLTRVRGLGGTERTNRLAELATNPFMLSAMLYVFERRPEDDLPTNPGGLLREVIDLLWSRPIGQLGDEELALVGETWRQAFAGLAFRMTVNNYSQEASTQWALTNLGGPSLVRQVFERGRALVLRRPQQGKDRDEERSRLLLRLGSESGLLVREGDRIRFLHPLLHYAFVAEHLKSQALRKVVPAPRFYSVSEESDRPRLLQFFFGTAHWHRVQTEWDEIAFLLFGMQPAQADEFFRQIAEIDPFLAGTYFAQGVVPKDETCNVAIRALLRFVEKHESKETESAAEAMVKYGEAAVPALGALAEDIQKALGARVLALDLLGRIGGARAEAILRGQKSNPRVDETKLTELEKNYQEFLRSRSSSTMSDEQRKLLKTAALMVSQFAAHALIFYFTGQLKQESLGQNAKEAWRKYSSTKEPPLPGQIGPSILMDNLRLADMSANSNPHEWYLNAIADCRKTVETAKATLRAAAAKALAD